MVDMHRTNVQEWRCQCYAFNCSAYHLCSHLIRLYGKPYPCKGEAIRQHVTPLLWIEGEHTADQRFCRKESIEGRGVVEPADLGRLGMDLDMLIELEDRFEDDDDNEDLPRLEEKRKEYLEWLTSMEKAIQYAREEISYGGERFKRLPPPNVQGLKQLMSLTENVHILDHERKRRKTWGAERAGANRYRG